MSSLLASKVIPQLLLPPGGLILLGLSGLIFWQRWWGRGLAGISLALFWLLSTAPIRDILLEPLESAHAPISLDYINTNPGLDTAIVLLGSGVYAEAPEYDGRDGLAGAALGRTWYAAELAKKTGLSVYITGGTPLSDDLEPESEIISRYLVRLGLPETHLHVENMASNTWENAMLLKPMLAHAGIRQVILVTNAFHMPRAVWCFESQGISVLPAPCSYIAGRRAYDLRSYFPHWGVLRDSSQALHEYLGLVWYGLHYGHGVWPLEPFENLSLFSPV